MIFVKKRIFIENYIYFWLKKMPMTFLHGKHSIEGKFHPNRLKIDQNMLVCEGLQRKGVKVGQRQAEIIAFFVYKYAPYENQV